MRGPDEPAGTLSANAASELGLPAGIPIGPGTGDNMAAALGIGAKPGEVVISLGTSGTAFAVSEAPTADPTGEVAGFADATGRFLPLACMLNCTRVLDLTAGLVGLDRDEALARAGAMPPGAEGVLMLPYLGGERTPNLPNATGMVRGLTDDTTTPDMLVRAALDGVAAGLAYCVDALARLGITAPSITIVGGGAIHPTWQQAVADATGCPIQVRSGVEHAARGAAVQSAAVAQGVPVSGIAEAWRPGVVAEVPAREGLREAFQMEARRALIQEMIEASH
jgi:xylulokinase